MVRSPLRHSRLSVSFESMARKPRLYRSWESDNLQILLALLRKVTRTSSASRSPCPGTWRAITWSGTCFQSRRGLAEFPPFCEPRRWPGPTLLPCLPSCTPSSPDVCGPSSSLVSSDWAGCLISGLSFPPSVCVVLMLFMPLVPALWPSPPVPRTFYLL